jgi:D-glucuronyl C5-epimerase C-terminus
MRSKLVLKREGTQLTRWWSSVAIAVIVGSLIGYTANLLMTSDPHSLPTITNNIDPTLGIPAVVKRPNNIALKPYVADQAGLQVRYEADIIRTLNGDMLYSPKLVGDRIFLPWQTSDNGAPGLFGIFPGNVITLLDNPLYDLGVGTLMVKARLDHNGLEGFIPLSTIIGDTVPANDDLWSADDVGRLKERVLVTFEGRIIYTYGVPRDAKVIEKDIAALLDPSAYSDSLSAGQTGVHPVYAANVVAGLLQLALRPDTDPDLKRRILTAAKTIFDNYFFPSAVEQSAGTVSWPYQFEWTTNWGIALKPPWYSAYTNGVLSSAAAIMFRLTDDERYRQLALKSGRYVGLPIEQGGAEYQVSGFRLPAEYVYQVQRTPNIRVLDGEIITLIGMYNAARLLSSWELYEIFVRQAFSLAMQLQFFSNDDGSLIFATYLERMPEHYMRDVWVGLLIIGNMTKNRQFLKSANALRPHIPAKWCESDGC